MAFLFDLEGPSQQLERIPPPFISQPRGQAPYGVALRLWDYMPVQSQGDTRIAVPQLSLDNCNRRAAVDEFASYRMAKRVKSRQWYPQLGQ